MPAYDCAATVQESIESILRGNLSEDDELVIVDDGSTDDTRAVLDRIKHPAIRVLHHDANRGGAAARNTAVRNARHEILFSLDADNVLAPGSVPELKRHLLDSRLDAAAFQELRYFRTSTRRVTHSWVFKAGMVTLADCLAGHIAPPSSGNYLFARTSWEKAGGYPEFAGALDAWGFGLRQLATGAKMGVLAGTFYFHRFGHRSYWVREYDPAGTSRVALQILTPFLELFEERDAAYASSEKDWFDKLDRRPLRLKSGEPGKTGIIARRWMGRLRGR